MYIVYNIIQQKYHRWEYDYDNAGSSVDFYDLLRGSVRHGPACLGVGHGTPTRITWTEAISGPHDTSGSDVLLPGRVDPLAVAFLTADRGPRNQAGPFFYHFTPQTNFHGRSHSQLAICRTSCTIFTMSKTLRETIKNLSVN